MDYTEINRCFETLNKKPGWYTKNKSIAEKIHCFDIIQNLATPGIIYSLIGFLKNKNHLLQAKAAETILFLYKKIKSLKEYEGALKHLPIEKDDLDFYRVGFDENTYSELLCIASFNRNGHVREKAVGELGRIKNAVALKFVLVRLSDWVPAVRKTALDAFISFLEDNFIETFLTELPTIDWLLKVQRVDLKDIYDRAVQYLLSQELSEEFLKKVSKLDDKSRFLFYKILLDHKLPTKDLVDRIMRDNSVLIRLAVIKQIPNFNQNFQKELLSVFLTDPSSKVRLSALYASKPFLPQFDAQVAVMLSDEAPSVRELSRTLLTGKGITFAKVYRERIIGGQLFLGSVLGLVDTGSNEDLAVFEAHINSQKSKVVVACLTGINRFDTEKAKYYSLELLTNSRGKVRNKAVEILAKNIDNEILEKVRGSYIQGDNDNKKAILKMFDKIGGWNIVGDLLIAITDKNESIQILGWELLKKWRTKVTKLFTTPSNDALDRANRIYDDLKINSLQMNTSRSELLRDLKFFLG